jgi:ABC-type multidrug transport system fused ATPase/permease subunit
MKEKITEAQYEKDLKILTDYRKKSYFVAYFLLITTFLIGGHRFYLHSKMGTPLTKKEKDNDDFLELVASSLLVFFLFSTPILVFYLMVTFIIAFISSMKLFLIFLIVAPSLFIFEAFNIYKNISSKKQEAIESFKVVEEYRSLRKEEEYEKQFVMENL